jgi:glucose-1-phosphate thymidylyltransferase
MAETLKIVIPMAGWGTRLRPHSWSKPKPLVAVGGRTSLDHLIGMFATVPDRRRAEFVFILSPYLGELHIPSFMKENYPHLTAHYVVQEEMKGQSHALYLARRHLSGPMISCFSDTYIETDFSFLSGEKADGVIWVKAVPDPRRFGVAEVNSDGWVTRLTEKPQTVDNGLALVGCYYFRHGEDLMSAIEEQMQRDLQLKNEYFLADAVNLMLDHKARFRPRQVEAWFDTGTIDATLETNRYMLETSWRSATPLPPRPGVEIRPPVFIHDSAHIQESVIGPYASIGPGCRVVDSLIQDSILEANSEIRSAALQGSIIGRRAIVEGRGLQEVLTLNIGDDSTVRTAPAAKGQSRAKTHTA